MHTSLQIKRTSLSVNYYVSVITALYIYIYTLIYTFIFIYTHTYKYMCVHKMCSFTLVRNVNVLFVTVRGNETI